MTTKAKIKVIHENKTFKKIKPIKDIHLYLEPKNTEIDTDKKHISMNEKVFNYLTYELDKWVDNYTDLTPKEILNLTTLLEISFKTHRKYTSRTKYIATKTDLIKLETFYNYLRMGHKPFFQISLLFNFRLKSIKFNIRHNLNFIEENNRY